MVNVPSWDAYYMLIAEAVARRSSCVRRQIGAVIVLDNRIVSTGYNGTPRGLKNCNEGGCARCNTPKDQILSGTRLDECLCCHAEENAIIQAAYHGIAIKGSHLYTTVSPCLTCAKMMVNAGIVSVNCGVSYSQDDAGHKLLKEAWRTT